MKNRIILAILLIVALTILSATIALSVPLIICQMLAAWGAYHIITDLMLWTLTCWRVRREKHA